jgi:hypothetical protein
MQTKGSQTWTNRIPEISPKSYPIDLKQRPIFLSYIQLKNQTKVLMGTVSDSVSPVLRLLPGKRFFNSSYFLMNKIRYLSDAKVGIYFSLMTSVRISFYLKLHFVTLCGVTTFDRSINVKTHIRFSSCLASLILYLSFILPLCTLFASKCYFFRHSA